MTNARREFLLAIFRILEAKSIPYCVLRNYQNIYDDATSDVDLAVEPDEVLQLKACLDEAAAATGYRFIHGARYVNYSYVYWHPAAGFVRMDLETEIRWRVFPVLSAKAIIGLRRKHGEFFIPHPRHESVSLFCQAIWQQGISEKYRRQLGLLYQQLDGVALDCPSTLSPVPKNLENFDKVEDKVPDKVSHTPHKAQGPASEELCRTLRATFGSAGDELTRCQQRMLAEEPPATLWKIVRRSLIRNAFSDAPTRHELLAYVARDVRRLCERVRRPAGISLTYVSDAQPMAKLNQFMEQIEFLYPVRKSSTLSSEQSKASRLDWQLRWQRFRTLFKGGLFMRSFRVAEDTQIPAVIRTHSRYLYPSRTFIWAEWKRFGTYVAHVESGNVAEFGPEDATIPAGILQFISRILERSTKSHQAHQRGAFVVLVGLDGSGKTTVARKLCCLAGQNGGLARVRYFHWQPALKQIIFPLPAFRDEPRKRELKRNLWQSFLSAARLFKNVILTNFVYRLRLARLLRVGTLVLIDRYYYNYFLDPVSVKYYGPRALLDYMRKWFPQPDLVVVLKAPTEVLLARKRELSSDEISRQNAVLQSLEFRARRVIELDAAQTPEQIAMQVLEQVNVSNR